MDEPTRQFCRGATDLVGLSTVFGGNFGDLLGPYLFEKIAKMRPRLLSVNDRMIRDLNPSPHYLAVGSILKHVTRNAHVWGIGIMHARDAISIRNKARSTNIHAVRGPLSLEAMVDAKILDSSDEIALGDPALLLPLFYRPTVTKQHRLGIVPHYTEFEEAYEMFASLEDTCVIRIGGLGKYGNVECVIDQIRSCERIASSSLHGIVTAHAYGIPATWCNFTSVTKAEAKGTTRLKFYDYYKSLELDVGSPVDMTAGARTITDDAVTLPYQAVIGCIQEQLVKSCPFNASNLA